MSAISRIGCNRWFMYSVTVDVEDSKHGPWIRLFPIGFDSASCAQTDSLGQDELGKRMHIDKLVVMGQVLSQ